MTINRGRHNWLLWKGNSRQEEWTLQPTYTSNTYTLNNTCVMVEGECIRRLQRCNRNAHWILNYHSMVRTGCKIVQKRGRKKSNRIAFRSFHVSIVCGEQFPQPSNFSLNKYIIHKWNWHPLAFFKKIITIIVICRL